jgi:hypothetical protein
LFNIRVFAHFHAQRLADHPFEGRRMTLRRPQFQFGIASGANLQQGIVAAIVEFESGDCLCVAAIQVLGETKHGGQPPHDLAALAAEFLEVGVPARGRRPPVIAGDQRDGFDFVGLEPAQIAVLDQIVRMPMMAFVADVHAGVVENRGVFQPLAFLVGHAVDGAGAIE